MLPVSWFEVRWVCVCCVVSHSFIDCAEQNNVDRYQNERGSVRLTSRKLHYVISEIPSAPGVFTAIVFADS